MFQRTSTYEGEAMVTTRIVTATLVAAAIAGAQPVHAAPWDDPHHPDASTGSCAAGGNLFYEGGILRGVCTGMPYDDGSMWQEDVNKGGPGVFTTTITCVVRGPVFFDPAPPGACGGEWQGQ